MPWTKRRPTRSSWLPAPIGSPMRNRRLTTPDVPTVPDDSLDNADDEQDERGPLRRCVVTRVQGERARMLRFVIGPDGSVVPDLTATLPGRGIWLSARRDVLETAQRRGAFARAARAQVVVPSDLTDRVRHGLLRRVTDCLGLARRAGQAVAGYTKAREWLVAGRAALIVQAADGSRDERARFLSGQRTVSVISPLSGEELGRIFGRDHAVHIAVTPGALATRLEIEAERLAGLTGDTIEG
ncbi:LSU ribosomal protein L7AE [Granulibacter bethesdensis CGDNIH4]|nr:LSU ribosomal protein L7AE [Granulibacter bethesdensis CGDNIH4]